MVVPIISVIGFGVYIGVPFFRNTTIYRSLRRVQGLGFKVYGSGFGVWGLGFRTALNPNP